MSDMALLTPRLFTVDEFQRMADTGLLRPDERVELLDGLVVEMSPVGTRHWDRHARLTRYLVSALGDRALVVPQGSFPLNRYNMPQPDLALLAPFLYGKARRVPELDEIFAFIEISDTSFEKDGRKKLAIYAAAGVPDYLVVDIERNRLLHHSAPELQGYRSVNELTYGGQLALARLPDITLSAAPFLEVP